MRVRPYDPDGERGELWSLKRAFEREIGGGTGDDAKREAYETKLTRAYRRRYLDWVDRCVADDARCVTVAPGDDGLLGYAFVLPERLALIWDAAVLNELYVVPDRRGTGVSDALLGAAIDLSREQDLPLPRLVLDVDADNTRAAAFYARHGFEHWGEMVARGL